VTLGQLLRNRRTELGKSIEQIATATRIHLKVLQALENDEYSQLPARAFTRGFIITYCKSLQLNPDEILSSYHDFLESKFSERPEKDKGHQGYAFETRESEQQKKGMMIIASSAAFFAILTLLFFKPQNHKHREKHKELMTEQTESNPSEDGIPGSGNPTSSSTPMNGAEVAARTPVVSASPMIAANPSPSSTPVPTPSEIVKATPTPAPNDNLNKGDLLKPEEVGVKLNVQAKEDVLVKYQSDERPPFNLNLRKDRQLVIKASQKIRFETEHPELLVYKIKTKKVNQAAYGELKEKSIQLIAE
jgi:cytoskeletal protein RodZ